MKNAAWLSWLAILFCIAALFGPALFADRSFAFRDAGHFYYPLFDWCCREWAQGRVPLWNPQENGGLPVLADSTSSVFYPGKLVFLLPLAFAARYKVYIVSHVTLAAAGSFCLARYWGSSCAAAALAAIAYACGGGVVFQYSNVVFLVGAAWLPLAVLAADRMLRRPHWLSAMPLAVILAMMVLGGDPQAAYHVILIVGLYVALVACHRIAVSPTSSISCGDEIAPLRAGLLHAATAAAVAYLLAAVQIWPSAEAIRASERATFHRPRNIYEAAAVAMQRSELQTLGETRSESIARGLLGEPEERSHHELAYDFSVGPWRLIEYGWPNIGGRMFPTHRRWMSLVPGEGRVWTPTLYLGLLPAVFALAQIRFRQGNAREVWLSLVLVLFTLGSFGFYGLGWLAREISAALSGQNAQQLAIGSPVGGVYWLLMTLLPTYAHFRYPAKLLPFVSLAASQLAAMGLDRVAARATPRFARVLLSLVGASLIAAASMLLGGARASAAFAEQVLLWSIGAAQFEEIGWSDPSFGPFDAAGAHSDAAFALLQTAIVGGLGYMLFAMLRTAPARAERCRLAMVFLTAVDVAIANAWLITTAPAELWQAQAPIANYVNENSVAPIDGAALSPRVYRANIATWRPPSFRNDRSSNRPTQIVQWEHETLFPKHQLASGMSLVESYGSIKSADHESLLRVAKEHGPRQTDKSMLPQPALLRLLGVEYLVLPSSHRPEFAERIADSRLNPPSAKRSNSDLILPENASLWRMKHTLPRAWIVHDVEVMNELDSHARSQTLDQRSADVLFPGGRARDFEKSAVVETNQPLPAWRDPQELGLLTPAAADERCVVTRYDPQRVVIDANLMMPGLVVLSDTWHPAWKATVTAREGKKETSVYRTNRICRGVWLPPGQHTIEYRFRSTSFERGAWISGLSWLILGAVLVVRLIMRWW